MKNKAFTLIELLAVIVILAIIALIAVPIVINIIENTKDSSVIRSTELYLDAVELYIARSELDNKQIENGQYNIEDLTEIEVKGQVPVTGMIEILDGQLIDYSLKIGDYLVNYDETKKKPIANKKGILRRAKINPVVDLVEGMTPVQYINDNWTVVDGKANDWYNYDNQEWANAVILNSGVIKNAGDTIDVSSEVKGMFVYVPRYEYKIEGQYGTHTDGTAGTQELPGEIEVNFLSKNINIPSGEYRVHPAFTFGDEELNGIWVGKFETSASKTSECYESGSNCNNTNQDPYIIPNVNSLRSQMVSNQFATAQKFNTYITAGDSHMMKNSEWGAVAYLSQSKYGKYGNSNYIGVEKEVRVNNCSSYITGVGADSRNASANTSTCTTNTYETSNGQAASTTGNITGVYDMNGGAHEYVMGVLADSNGKPRSGRTSTFSSGYEGTLEEGKVTGKKFPDSKYYDLYIIDDEMSACNGGVCYGQAISETSSWYKDLHSFVTTSGPWLVRGCYNNGTNVAGVFYYTGTHMGGQGGGDMSFRVVITNDIIKEDRN